MGQLHQEYLNFKKAGVQIIVVAPDRMEAVRRYWADHGLPFAGLADPGHRTARLYGQEVRLLTLGRVPLLILIDQHGVIRWTYYSRSMADFPDLPVLLKTIQQELAI